MSPNGKLDPENIGIAVGISLISCLEAEIHAFEVWRTPFWIFPLPVWSHSLPIGSSGLLDPQYISLVAVAVGISYLSSLGVELLAFKVLRPPSWIIPFRFGCTVSALVPLECWTPKNMGVAVGILLLSCLQAEITWGYFNFLPPSAPRLSKTCVKKAKL